MRLADRSLIPALALFSALALAHPMGNFSVNHYSRLAASGGVIRLDYVLDLAEIPAFQELQAMGVAIDKLPGADDLGRWARRKAPEWLSGLDLTTGSGRAAWRLLSARAEFAEGVGGLPTIKIYLSAMAPAASGQVSYRDRNFPGRAGWKEIVVASSGATLAGAEPFRADISGALSNYPPDAAPPQVLEASFQVSTPPAALPPSSVPPPVVHPPQPAAPAPQLTTDNRQVQWSDLTRGDFLSQMLSGRRLDGRLVLLSLAAALCLGAFHALSPGHGKTIVAAYLVGSRGTVRHAFFLGGVVTLTHTIGVFALGLLVLLAGPRLVPERLYPWLGVACGLSIVVVGAVMFRKRWAALSGHHHHHHDHPHHGHHHHGGRSHAIPEKVTWGSLLALGVSGGILPCPSALVVLLGAISLHRAALGILLILAFSLGLAVVLSSIGVAMVQARSLFDRLPIHSGFTRRLPVLSSAVVSVLGLGIALQALTTAIGAR